MLGEVRPTHRQDDAQPRHWRTRKDAFEIVWPEILAWLQETPEATAKQLFRKLQEKYPGKFKSGQLRTLQRRIRIWRQIMAKQLVFSDVDSAENGVEVYGPISFPEKPKKSALEISAQEQS